MTVRHAKMQKVMHEFKEGTLRSGSKQGPRVTSRAQAIAIGMSEEREAATERHGGRGRAARALLRGRRRG